MLCLETGCHFSAELCINQQEAVLREKHVALFILSRLRHIAPWMSAGFLFELNIKSQSPDLFSIVTSGTYVVHALCRHGKVMYTDPSSGNTHLWNLLMDQNTVDVLVSPSPSFRYV
jgi:hypothetical protein